jgi:RNA polymerase sigma-70 factor (sigma-E family)
VEFDDFVRRRGPALVALARLLSGDRQAGEDLTQEVLARAFARWRRISAMDAPEAYLRRMLVNATITRGRRAASRELVTDSLPEVASADDLSAGIAERDALWRLVRTLPAKQRAAIVLRYYENLDDSAIAAALGCAPVTVRTQILRALANLRTRVADTEPVTPGGTR